jgi:hypothetical protein
MTNFRTLRISHENMQLIRAECRKEFLENHPEFKSFRLTDNFMVAKIIEYYLKH